MVYTDSIIRFEILDTHDFSAYIKLRNNWKKLQEINIMIRKFSFPLPDSPVSPFIWRLILFLSGVYFLLCLIMVALRIFSHHYGEAILLVFSMLFFYAILIQLWTGVVYSFGRRFVYRDIPESYWLRVALIFIVGVVLFFVLGSGFFIQVH